MRCKHLYKIMSASSRFHFREEEASTLQLGRVAGRKSGFKLHAPVSGAAADSGSCGCDCLLYRAAEAKRALHF